MRAFVLVKDEATNLLRSIPALLSEGLSVVVLDSGSTDGSQRLVADLEGVDVREVEYRSHLETYNRILADFAQADEWVLILDADMIVSRELISAVREAGNDLSTEVVLAPIEMWWAGMPLRMGSLCPAKAIAFRAGRPLFVAFGHGERLRDDVRVNVLPVPIIHDDRKPFSQTLATQARYGENLAARVAVGQGSRRDRIRARWPVFVALTPLWTYLVRGGFLSGRVGIVYALDRLIAEAILHRQCLVRHLESGKE